jgi:phospholipase A1
MTMTCPKPSINHAAPLAALLLAGAGVWPSIGSAESTQSCAAIDEDLARLACYDRVHGRQPSAPGAGVAPVLGAKSDSPTPTVPTDSGTPSAATTGNGESASASLLTRAWSFGQDTDRYLIKLNRPNYLNPVRYQSRTNDRPFQPLFVALDTEDSESDNVEAAFQISFKARIWASDDRRLGFWLAYTQQSFWQVYNDDKSSPFRDTNYEPELTVAWQPRRSWGGFDWQLLSIGYNHESNGRADPISRSWDRVIAEIGIEKGNFALLLRPWLRIDDESSDTDNPDITDYYGYGDVTAVYKQRGHSFTVMGRGNPVEKKGAVRATWMTPPLLGPLRGYVVLFSGYGDTLLDYNFRQNTVSAGIALNDLLDR